MDAIERALTTAAESITAAIENPAPGLTFGELRTANYSRALRWHRGGLEEWSVNDWLTAFAGEAGEACNAGKKLKRIEDNIQQHGRIYLSTEEAAVAILDELADTVIYADLVAARLGMSLSGAIVRKFNAISERENFPELLPE